MGFFRATVSLTENRLDKLEAKVESIEGLFRTIALEFVKDLEGFFMDRVEQCPFM
jgi:hypothetical protein